MSDVTLSYKGSDILELSDSGSATLKTGGTYCEADIELEYVKPSGGGSAWEHVQYALAEDWTTTASGGNTLNFYNTFLSGTEGKVVIVLISNNTVTGNSKASSVVGINGVGHMPNNGKALFFCRTTATNLQGTNYDFFMSTGSVIDVYSSVYPWGGN